jgi:predicted dehydrogenase
VTRDEIRIGVIGTGMMGCEHIRNIASLDGAVVSAFSDPHEMSHTWARDNLAHGGSNTAAEQVTGFHDHRELLDSDLVDAVIIASPNHTHVDVLRDVLATDLPCLVEKPMCTTIADCHEVIGAASTRSALTWVGLEYRYMPPIATLVQRVRQGDVGDVKMMAIREHRFPFLQKVNDWNRFTKNTGGTLVEKCCHFFDLMNLVIGARPRFVYASGGQDVNHLDERYADGTPDILDNAFVIVDYDNGVRASLDLCMFAEASRNEQEISVVGSRGKIEAALPGDGHVHIGTRAGRALTTVAAPIDPMVAHVGFHFGASFVEVARFCDAIRNDTTPEVTVTDGLWSVVIGVAAHRSIDEGRRVAIEELMHAA